MCIHSSAMITALLVGIFFCICAFISFFQPKYFPTLLEKFKGRLPPGPLGWPIIGVTGIKSDAPWETFTEWASKYGPIMSFFNGSEFTIVLSDSDVIKAAMRNPAFDGRPLNHSSKQYFHQGIGFAEGAMWKLHRKLVVSSMRQLSGGASQFDEHLKKCSWKVVRALEDMPKEGSDPLPVIANAVAAAISFLVFKDALMPGDCKYAELTDCCEKVFSVNPSTDIMNTFPFLKKLPNFQKHHNFFARAHKDLFQITKSVVMERQADICSGNVGSDGPVDFIEAMVQLKGKDSADRELSDEEIVVMATELYLAGTQDTLNVLHWAVLLLVIYPKVQKKLQRHIHNVVGNLRAPSVMDKSDLIYLEAFIFESQRFSSSMPFPLPHRVVEDTDLVGFHLPVDSAVIVNAFAVNQSRSLWNDPEEFRPERFIDEDGNLNNLCHRTLGFGEGRRGCPGEHPARLILIMMLATILQNLDLAIPEQSPPPKIVRSNGTASKPPHFQICVTICDDAAPDKL